MVFKDLFHVMFSKISYGGYMRKQMHENEFTSLLERLNYLKRIRRVEIAEALRFATELGDLRENAEYDAAVDDYQRMEREIYLLEKEIKDVELITQVDNSYIMIGSTVVLEIENEVETYVIKNSSNFDLQSISADSILGKSLLGHKVGDVVSIDCLEGLSTVRIKEIY